MTTTVTTRVQAFALIALSLAVGAMGIYVGEVDDSPGAGGIGLILMVAGLVLGVRTARHRAPAWAVRTALAAGVIIAALALDLTRAVAAAVPLFPASQQVPSVAAPAQPRQYAAAAARARELVRAAVLEQNLPGVSVAVGAGGTVVWAEGFGWRDVGTRTPVTPSTRFNIGTAASAVAPAAAPLGLASTGADAAKEWSPEAIGEESEDFPPLAFLRHQVWQPLGLMAAGYPLPGERATFYVPRLDDNPRRGRRLMYMRDLACCANGMAFSSTPSDLVRVAMAASTGSLDGALAGGTVMSLVTRPDRGLVVAVTSNIAHADTSSLARAVAEAFAE